MTGRARMVALGLVWALFAGGCSLLGGGGSYDVVAYFPRAVSLYESGAVQVLGLPAGKITDIEVLGDRVKVTMAIDDDIPIPEGVQAVIVPQSLIGERRVQLFPPYQEGDPVIADGHEIAIEDTIIPVEPDEALAALKEFLDSLDPEGLGELIDNAATALDGQGENLGAALDELAELVDNVEANDDDIISIAERFDDFTEALLTRETQLAESLDDFAVVADVLAQERASIEALVTSLAELSVDGLDVVSEHAVRLRRDVAVVTRLAQAIDANLDGVQDLIDGGRGLVFGFNNAYNEDLRAVNLRNSFTPLVAAALAPLFESIGLPVPCIDGVDVACSDGGLLGGLDAGADATPATLDRPTSPVDDIVGLLGLPTAGPDVASSPPPADDDPLTSFLGTFLGVGS